MKKILTLFLYLSLLSSISYAQISYGSKNVYVEKGDFYFDKNDYKKAIVYYNMAFAQDKNYYSVLRKAEAFKALKLYDEAADCYQVVLDSDLKASRKIMLKYAMLLLKNGDIKGFEKWVQNYKREVHGEMYDYTQGEDVRVKMYKDTAIIIVENEIILNTAESEICPSVSKDRLFFASTRKNLTGTKGNNFYNIYAAVKLDNGKPGKLNVFNQSLNSKQSESTVAVSEQANMLYFTKSTSLHDDVKTYTANIPSGIDKKTESKAFTIQGTSNIGHVSFSSDEKTMFFVSKSLEGSGGMDIFSSELVDGNWSAPKNVGNHINTGKNEMYPCIVSDSILYFTSDGHNGLGGLDLYRVNLNDENATPENLGNKINSKHDDFCLSFNPEALTGYFCSNRPGGFGKEDIYRVHLLNLKIKRKAYQFKSTPSIEDNKINLYLSDGQDFNIASEDNSGFNFGFWPLEGYNMVIQHENPLARGVYNNESLSKEKRLKGLMNPKPKDRAVIKLDPGSRYQFTVGMKPISSTYKNSLNDLSSEYQNKKTDIDLTALAKELLLMEGEVYTVRFEKDNTRPADPKAKEVTSLAVNNNIVPVSGRSFFFVLPLDIEVSFNIQTDIEYFKEKYNPKKAGVKLDTAKVSKQKPSSNKGFPILVNTTVMEEAKDKMFANDLTIIPGSFYTFTLTKFFEGTDQKLEIFVPLTKGVKYNLGKESRPEINFDTQLEDLMNIPLSKLSQEEELIDITVLSKDLDISPDDSIMFTLEPVKKFGEKASQPDVPSLLTIDGQKYFLNRDEHLKVMLRLDENTKVNIQTDLDYVEENFDLSAILLKIDTVSYSTDVEQKSKNIITDPVFDVVVVNFDLNKFDVREDAKNILKEKVVNTLKEDDRLYVTIKGYTDPLGDAEYNKKLSGNRAQAVKDYLAAEGIGENRIRTFSFGETESLQKGLKWKELNENQLQEYRKVEIVIYLPK